MSPWNIIKLAFAYSWLFTGKHLNMLLYTIYRAWSGLVTYSGGMAYFGVIRPLLAMLILVTNDLFK